MIALHSDRFFQPKNSVDILSGREFASEVPTATIPAGSQAFICSCVFASIDQTHISWGSGTITFADGTSQAISANASQVVSGTHYIYFDLVDASPNVLKLSTTYSDCVGTYKGLVAVAKIGGTGQKAFVSSLSQTNIFINEEALLAECVGTDAIKASAVTAIKISVADLAAIHANIGSCHINAVLDIGTSGGIYQGTGTFASPTTGLKISNSGGIGKVEGFNTGVVQAYFGTDGKLYAASGAVVLDFWGISMLGSGGVYLAFYNGAGSTLYGIMYGQDSIGMILSSANSLDITLGPSSHVLVIEGQARPNLNNTYDLGGASYRWQTVYAGNFSSNVATGTSPFVCASTTLCSNLNADYLDGSHASDFATSGHTHSVGSHYLDGVLSPHTVSGLTTGHFLKATSATTFGFAAHGLSYSDVGAAASGHNHSGTYLEVGGGTPLTGNWNAGNYAITAEGFRVYSSDADIGASGTPFLNAYITKVLCSTGSSARLRIPVGTNLYG